MKNCTVCGKPLPDGYKKDICKECKKIKYNKWLYKYGRWIVGGIIISAVSAIIMKLESNSSEEEDTSYITSENNLSELIKHEPGQKYWNSETGNWEKDGMPYTYRVSYTDRRDGKVHVHDYADVDNGYEDYQYYNKQWWAADTQWDHIPPDEE